MRFCYGSQRAEHIFQAKTKWMKKMVTIHSCKKRQKKKVKLINEGKNIAKKFPDFNYQEAYKLPHYVQLLFRTNICV